MNKLDAYKMDGLGNDFIIFDKREKPILLSKNQIKKISDRSHTGCDQVIFIAKDRSGDFFLEFYNSDGGETAACGNGSRCVASLLMKENNEKKITLKTKFGILKAELDNNNLIKINMGSPNFAWHKIPLVKKMDHKNLKIKIYSIEGKEVVGGFSLSVGNPHLIFFIDDLNEFDLNKIGPQLENHNYFPERCNITLASIINRKYIKVKVWERGAGLTLACGTAACATAVSGSVLGLNDKSVDIEFLEGSLNINWKEDNNIYMTGKVSKVKKIVINI